jgi:uncharacterized membrane protein (DUF441 family)
MNFAHQAFFLINITLILRGEVSADESLNISKLILMVVKFM